MYCDSDVCVCLFVSVCVLARSMMSQITSNDEQAVELTDKIAAMEEELRKVCVWSLLGGLG